MKVMKPPQHCGLLSMVPFAAVHEPELNEDNINDGGTYILYRCTACGVVTYQPEKWEDE